LGKREGIDLFEVLGKSPGSSTELTLRILCVAAFLRSLDQGSAPALIASGRSRLVLLQALLAAATRAVAIALCLVGLAAWAIDVRLACAWLAAYALLQPVGAVLLSGVAPGLVRATLRGLCAPIAAAAIAGASWSLLQPLSPLGPGGVRLALHGICIVASYGALVWVGAGGEGMLRRRSNA
jgi:O-antigen/teichoic acid export membrane protein